jgi:hypothetical protein
MLVRRSRSPKDSVRQKQSVLRSRSPKDSVRNSERPCSQKDSTRRYGCKTPMQQSISIRRSGRRSPTQSVNQTLNQSASIRRSGRCSPNQSISIRRSVRRSPEQSRADHTEHSIRETIQMSTKTKPIKADLMKSRAELENPKSKKKFSNHRQQKKSRSISPEQSNLGGSRHADSRHADSRHARTQQMPTKIPLTQRQKSLSKYDDSHTVNRQQKEEMKSQIIEANKVSRLRIDTRDHRIKSKKVTDWMDWVRDTKRYFTNNIILYDNHSDPVKEFIMKQDNQNVNYTEKTKVSEYGNIHDVKMMNEARRHYAVSKKEPE